MIFYYSGCGNSRWVAQELSRRLGQDLFFIPEEINGSCLFTLKDDEPLGFVFPTYAWRPPLIVRRFVQKMKLDGSSHSPYTFMVTTCGDSIGYADKIFARLLRRTLSLQLKAAYSIQMPETYVNLPGFNLDSKQDEYSKLALAQTNLPSIADFIRHKDIETNVVRGKMPCFNSSVMAFLFEKLLITDRRFNVEQQCISCGKCAEVCPVDNITMEPISWKPSSSSSVQKETLRPLWHGHCLSCMACYHYCPTNAIQWGKTTKGKGQYHFPDDREQQ